MTRISAGVLFGSLVFAALLPVAKAQAPTGSITGIIQDSTGAIIVGAQVSVLQVDTGTKRDTISNESGSYSVPLLNPSNYTVSVTMEGFRAVSHTGITLLVDQAARIDFTLEPGSVTETVEITAQAALVQSEQSSVGAVVQNSSIANLPLNGGITANLALLVPGVTPGASTQAGSGSDTGRAPINFWINGGRGAQNDVLVDGIVLTVPELGPDYQVPLLPQVDVVQEFKVQTNSLAAEFGRTEGGIIEYVYKSGTNSFHGSAFNYLRNSVLDANNFFTNRSGLPLPSFKRNQFGGTIGGPIVIPHLVNGRDKLFFFIGYEGLEQGSATSLTTTVPTLLQRIGNFSQPNVLAGGVCVKQTIYDPRSTTATATGGFVRTPYSDNIIPASALDPVGLKAASYYPLPTGPGAACTGANNYNFSGVGVTTAKQPDGRLDYYPTPNDKFFLRMTARRGGGHGVNTYGDGNLAATSNPHPALVNLGDSATLSYTHIFTPTLIAEGRIGFGRIASLSAGTAAGAIANPSATSFNDYSFNMRQLGWTGSATKFIDQLSAYGPLGFPSITSNGYAPLSYSFPFSNNTGTGFQYAGSLTKIHGSHTIKGGADYRIGQATGPNGNNSSGYFVFSPSFTQGPNPLVASSTSGNSIASLLVGLGTGGAQINPRAMESNNYFAVYVQDDWRLSRKLVINVGFRYDVEPGRTDRYDQLSWFDFSAASPLSSLPGLQQYGKIYGPNLNQSLSGGLVFPGVNGNPRGQYATDWNRPGPRIGLAYSADTKTVFRMGYGILYEPYIGRSYASTSFIGFDSLTTWASSLNGVTPQNYLSNPFPNGLQLPTGSSAGLLTAIGGNIGTNGNDGREGAVDRNSRVASVQQWNATIQRILPGNVSVSVSYVGQKGTHLADGGGFQMDQLYPSYASLGNQLLQTVSNPFYGQIATGPLSAPTTTLGQLLRPYPQFTNVLDFRPASASSIFHGGQLNVTKRLNHGGSVTLAYTKSKEIDDSSNNFDFRPNSSGVNSGSIGGSGVHQDVYNRRADRSVGLSDVAQRLVVSYVLELPFGRGRWIGSHWNSFTNAFLGGWQVNGITTFQSGFPLAIEASTNTSNLFSDNLRPNVNGDTSLSSDRPLQNKLAQWFNTAAFSQPAPFTFGNLARTVPSVRGDGQKNFDFSIFKHFELYHEGRVKAELRGEFYNVFNHPWFALPNQYYGQSSFGVVSSQINSPRQTELALKILF